MINNSCCSFGVHLYSFRYTVVITLNVCKLLLRFISDVYMVSIHALT